MEVISRTSQSSCLNPNAPLFVPLAYRTVEDFSDDWWALVHSSPWFRDYWLQECFQDPQSTQTFSEFDDAFFPEIDTLLEDDEEGNDAYNKDLIPMGSLKWKKNRFVAETPKYREKAPKIVNVKVSPRPIQQPR